MTLVYRELKWDGSTIGNFLSEHVILIEGQDYFIGQLQFQEGPVTSYIAHLKNTDVLIIDELKPLFKVSKIGTHRFYVMGKSYIMFKPNVFFDQKTNSLTFIPDVKYLEWKEEKHRPGEERYVEHEIQNCLAMCQLLGISKANEKSIVIRKNYSKFLFPDVVLFHPSQKIVPHDPKRVLSLLMLNRYFKDSDINTILAQNLGIIDDETLNTKIFELRCLIEEVLKRIDTERISMSSLIHYKMTEMLSVPGIIIEREFQIDTSKYRNILPP